MKILSIIFLMIFCLSLYSQEKKALPAQKTPSAKTVQKSAVSSSPKTSTTASETSSAIDQSSPFDRASAALKSEKAAERKSAADTLTATRDARALPLLKKMLSDPDDSVRISAIEGLGVLRCSDCDKEISAILANDKNILVRQSCVTSLSYMGSVSDPSALIKAAQSEDKSLKISAIRTIGSLKVKAAENDFVALLKKEKDQDIKKALIDSLGKMKSEKGLEEIKKSLSDEDPVTRQYAVRALGDSGNKNFIEHLKARLGDENPSVKLEAGYSLAKLGDNSGLQTAYSYLDNSDFSLQNLSMQIIALAGDASSLKILQEKIKSTKDSNIKTMLEFTAQRLQARLKTMK